MSELAAWVARLRAKDGTLFSADPEVAAAAAAYLGWVDLALPDPGLMDWLTGVNADGATDIVVVGMGGSSLGALAVRDALGTPVRLHILDSTHPAEVQRVLALDPATTRYVIASKSGSTAEVDAALAALWARCERDGSRFVAVTDPGSAMERRATEEGWAAIGRGVPSVGGRFSVLSVFGLLPLALAGLDFAAFRAGGALPDASWEAAAAMGLAWAERVKAGDDVMIVRAPGRYYGIALWLEQLVAESTGKQGTGLYPVAVRDDACEALVLEGRGGSLLGSYAPQTPAELGALFMGFQVATAACGSALGVNPFDQPNVQLAKDMARLQIARLEKGDVLASSLPVATRDEVRAAAEGAGYVAILAYVAETAANDATLRAWQAELGAVAPCSLGYGPRYLHSTGQYHKGGPRHGLHVLVVDEGAAEVPIPGRGYGFADLMRAQAYGDEAALINAGRRVVRVRISN